MNPSLKEQLKEWKRQHPESTPKKKKHRKNSQNPQEEHLSERELKELMGINQPVYRRKKGGAWRNGR